MNNEADAKMINEDTDIWSKAVGLTDARSILNVPGIDMDVQLEKIIMSFRALNKLNDYRYTPFSYTAPLYLDTEERVPLCTTDKRLAELWVSQINQVLQHSREAAIEYFVKSCESKEELNDKLAGLFTARCVDMFIDHAIGERDPQVKDMHYIGVVVSYWNAERNDNYDAAKKCEAAFNSL